MKWCILLAAAFLFSCVKDRSCEACENGYKDAIIYDAGPVEADGCGWVISLDSSHFYHPDTLSPVFKKNGLSVRVCYEENGEDFICGFNPAGLPVIHVIAIKEK